MGFGKDQLSTHKAFLVWKGLLQRAGGLVLQGIVGLDALEALKKSSTLHVWNFCLHASMFSCWPDLASKAKRNQTRSVDSARTPTRPIDRDNNCHILQYIYIWALSWHYHS